MVASNGEKIPVAAEDYHVELGIGQLHAGCKGNRPSVGSMIGIQVHISGSASRTAYSGNHHGFPEVYAACFHGYKAGREGCSNTASGAPDVGNAVRSQKAVQGVFHFF